MTSFGYTVMDEQAGPKQLVADAVRAEAVGFDFVAASDHYNLARGQPRIGQVGICYDADEAAARKRAHEQFRWFVGGWEVMAELPGPDHFAAASQAVREEDIAGQLPCGPALDAHVEAVKQFVDAGFTHVAVVQIGGGHPEPFLEWAESELLPALRRL